MQVLEGQDLKLGKVINKEKGWLPVNLALIRYRSLSFMQTLGIVIVCLMGLNAGRFLVGVFVCKYIGMFLYLLCDKCACFYLICKI